MSGKTSNESKAKYNAKAYDRLYPFTPKGHKAEIEACAKSVDETSNEFINKAIDERMERIQRKIDSETPFVAPPGESCPKNCKKRCTMIPAAENGKPVVEVPLCTLYGKEIMDNKKCAECLGDSK